MTNHDAEPNPTDFLDPTEYSRALGLFQKAVLKRGLFTTFAGEDFHGSSTYSGKAPFIQRDDPLGVRREITFQVGQMQTKVILNLHNSAIARSRQAADSGPGYQEAAESVEANGLSIGTIFVGGLGDEDSDNGSLGIFIEFYEMPLIQVTVDQNIPGTTPKRAADMQVFADFLGLDRSFATGEREEMYSPFTEEDLTNFTQGLERLYQLDSNEVTL
ncbi:MAG: hypothetical protein JWO47_862 [Candidatus Saccharibacteria bacterium]|nr:hypothetical protein [Candidatus Saccharibacteria bacterium]